MAKTNFALALSAAYLLDSALTTRTPFGTLTVELAASTSTFTAPAGACLEAEAPPAAALPEPPAAAGAAVAEAAVVEAAACAPVAAEVVVCSPAEPSRVSFGSNQVSSLSSKSSTGLTGLSSAYAAMETAEAATATAQTIAISFLIFIGISSFLKKSFLPKKEDIFQNCIAARKYLTIINITEMSKKTSSSF
jgi:hypothetical protein